MIITNKLNLPEAFVRATSSDDHKFEPMRFSVTELLLPTKQIVLQREHFDEIKEDVADRIPAMIGTAIHALLEKLAPENVETESKIESQFDQFTLAGKIDCLIVDDQEIDDYKSCSVSKVMKKDFQDWLNQGLMYALLVYLKRNIIIRKFKIYALMKDWSKLKANCSADYPQSAIYVWEYNIQDSDYDYITTFIKNKFNEIQLAMMSHNQLECTDEERWYTGTKYAVYKKAGDLKAAKVFDTEEEAHQFITEKCNGTGEIQVRPGEYLKCKYYCNAKEFCNQGDQNETING